MKTRTSLLLATALLFVIGCADSQQSANQTQGKNASQPTVAIPSNATEPEVIAAINKLGGSFRLNESGNITVVDLVDQVTDADLVQFKELTSLTSLSLRVTQITDEGLIHLKELSNLEFLNLVGSSVTDAGLVHLIGLTSLQDLSLFNTEVTDEGLVHLKVLTNLTSLSLDNTKVSDAGLIHLKELTNLKNLYLGGTQVSAEGLKEIREALPNCEILTSIM